MSHIETSSVVIKNLDALKRACEKLGLAFKEGQDHYRWWGTRHGESAYGGHCDHAIRVPGADYEIGVTKAAEDTWVLAHDPYYQGGLQVLSDPGSTGLEKLYDAYSAEVLKAEAWSKGYRVEESFTESGEIKLEVFT
jgi:hypothetical protein